MNNACPVPSAAVTPCGPWAVPAPVHSLTALQSPVLLGSSQSPVSERRAPFSGRLYCPVQSCPDHCPLTSRGWSSFNVMKGHCDRHLGGYLDGELLLEWLQSVGYGICEVCNRILSSRYRGRCPSCWPAFVESQPRPVSGRPLTEHMPSLDKVLGMRIRLRPSVPLGARDLWSTCLNTALGGIVAHMDTWAWIDFLILPSLVIPSPTRGGTSLTPPPPPPPPGVPLTRPDGVVSPD